MGTTTATPAATAANDKPRPDALLRLMPHDADAEKAVLGAMMKAPDINIPKAIGRLREETFYLPAHRIIFRNVVTIFSEGVFDLQLLASELWNSQEFDKIGGPRYLIDLVDGIPVPEMFDGYADLVDELARLREIIRISTEIAGKAYDRRGTSRDLAMELERLAGRIVDGGAAQMDTSWRKTLVVMSHKIEESIQRGGSVPGRTTGMKRLDTLTNAFLEGELWVLSGLSGTGKTALALNWVHALVTREVKCGIISYEMSRAKLAMRMLANDLTLNARDILYGRRQAIVPLMAQDERYGKWGCEINDSTDLDLGQVDNQFRKWAREGVKVGFVDYLSLVGLPREQRHSARDDLDVAERIIGLRKIAKKYDLCMVVLAQFSRKYDRNTSRRPMVQDLRGSSVIENEAHVIALMHMEDYEDEGSTVDVELIVAKCREGETGVVDLKFDKPHMRFYEADVQQAGAASAANHKPYQPYHTKNDE